MGKAVKKVKKVIKTVKTAVKATVKQAFTTTVAVVKGFVSGGPVGAIKAFSASGGIKIITTPINAAGSIVDDLTGTDIGSDISDEISTFVTDLEQVLKVVSGQYHADMEKVAAAKERYEDALEDYEDSYNEAVSKYNKGLNELLDRMDSLIAFHEIFQMAAANRVEAYGSFVGPDDSELLELFAEYKKLADKLRKEYDFVISLSQGGILEKIIYSIISIMGGLTHDMTAVLNGSANSDTWKRIGYSVVAVVLTVLAVLAAIPTGGMSLAWAIAILSIMSTLLMLDGMYAQGALMGAVMDVLDLVCNDILHLNKLVGSDFDKLDADDEGYQEMTVYIQAAITIAAIILSLGTMFSGSTPGGAPTDGGTAGAKATGETAQTTSSISDSISSLVTDFNNSSVLGIHMSNYKALYQVYSAASAVNDFMTASKAYDALKVKLHTDLDTVNEVILEKTNKNMIRSYKDAEYFLNDQQIAIDRYIWSMTSENMYVDPYATTPVANIRFKPDKKERSMTFGFEDMFNSENQAGGSNYFHSMLYVT